MCVSPAIDISRLGEEGRGVVVGVVSMETVFTQATKERVEKDETKGGKKKWRRKGEERK